MAGYRARVAVALAIVFATARAHIASHDNILRIQLWDAEGLSKTPEPTEVQKRTHKSRVNLDSLYHAMMDEVYGGSDPGRFTRHRVRHKRRRSRRSGEGEPWRFHQGERSVNVDEYDEVSAVSSVGSAGERMVGAPMTLRQDLAAIQEEINEEKQLPVVSKCCPSGQNLSWTPVNGSRVCMRTSLTFQPLFFQANDSFMSSYDDNLFEIIVDNPCYYDRYKLDPNVDLNDEFYLLVNGSLFVPYQSSPLLGPKDFCMETFYNATYPAGLTLPLVCFPKPPDDNKTSIMLILYATGLIISVPFLLATAAVYTFIRELRDTHGKSLACHTICLAVAFSCLAATQLAGDEFPITACTIMAYLIQYSFVSCFFWLNVMCFDTLLNVKRHLDAKQPRRDMRRRFAWYCVYAVVLPLFLLIFTMIMDLSPAVPNSYLKPNFGIKGCWFKTDKAALPYFYIPVALILTSNVIMFFFTARAFGKNFDKLKGVNAYELTHSSFSTADDWAQLSLALGEQIPMERSLSPLIDRKKRLKKYKKIFRMCCLLSVIMGMSWVFEVVSWAAGAGSTAFSVWSVFDFLNALQGLVIFAIFVMQQPVRSRVKFSKLCQMCRRRNSGSEVAVVSDRTSIEMGDGKRDAV